MEQHGQIQRAAIFNLAIKLFGEPKPVFAFVHIGNVFHRPDRMLVDRIMVIHIELGLRDDAAKFRQEPP